MITFDGACAPLEELLRGSTRQTLVAEAAASSTFEKALSRLGDGMRSDVWRRSGGPIDLAVFVRPYDRQTRKEGFHVLHDWDGVADRITAQTIPVDVLGYVRDRRAGTPTDPGVLAILLDYYLLHVLALLTLRIWDEGDADANLDRVNGLLGLLQGRDGSGQRFAANAETLILIGTSHFEVQEIGYDALLARVRRLNHAHRTNIALGHASSMGCHLRFGFEATYTRDTVKMRDDNVADYPWLCFALAGAMREYERLREIGADAAALDRVVEAMLNGLSADARAFVGVAPPSLASAGAERVEFYESFQRYKDDLVEAFARFLPNGIDYSPLAFYFNFSHNVVKGIVVDALLRGRPWKVSLNDLLTAAPNLENPESRVLLAKTLMGYARENPSRIGGRLMPVIVYDAQAGRRAFGITMKKLAG